MASSSPSLPPLGNFTAFPELPIEIRLEIWRQTLPGPRVVRVFYDKSVGECRSSTSIPIALQVCTESRKEALRFYKLSFGPQVRNEDTSEPKTTADIPQGNFFFDFENDTFFIVPRILDEDNPWATPEGLTPRHNVLSRSWDAAIRVLDCVEHASQIHKIQSFAAFDRLIGITNNIFGDRKKIQNHAVLKKLSNGCKRYLIVEDEDKHVSTKDKHVIDPIDLGGGSEGDGTNSYLGWFELELVRKEVRQIEQATGSKWLVAYLLTGSGQ